MMKNNCFMIKNTQKFAKLIMLTFFTCCVTITFVGCENGNKNIENSKLTSNGNDMVSLFEKQNEDSGMLLFEEIDVKESRRERNRRSL